MALLQLSMHAKDFSVLTTLFVVGGEGIVIVALEVEEGWTLV